MFVLKYMSLAATLLAIPQLCEFVDEVCSKYEKSLEDELLEATYLDGSRPPEDLISIDKISLDVTDDSPFVDKCMFSLKSLTEVLKLCHYDTSQLAQPLFSQISADRGGTGSDAETSSLSLDLTSIDSSSLDGSRRSSLILRKDTFISGMNAENVGIFTGPLTFDNIHKAINQPLEYWKQLENERTKEIVEMFTTLPFTRLVEIQKENIHLQKAVS
ncbi:unnamed protein product [Soboliphyme baturini]|uniref:Secreted protein n=1 Tax=Soboliphyme baturini TaxID=241478 RepID=A0A183ISV6_9BILA|nr:unnamed protein product [Soboliphyme baturini]